MFTPKCFSGDKPVKAKLMRNQAWLMASIILGGNIFTTLSVRAAGPAPGTVIENQATASYLDTADNQTKTVQSDIVKVTVAEVAGITISVIGSGGNLYPGGNGYIDFRITNVGNDPSQFFLPSNLSSITGATAGTLQIVGYIPAGGTQVNLTTPINITSASATGSLSDPTLGGNTTGGSLPADAAIVVRAPFTNITAAVGSSVTLTLGNTTGQPSTSNTPYIANGNDVYTFDNTGTANGDTNGNPINGDTSGKRQEASATQSVTVITRPTVTLSGTVWNDTDGSANNTFTNIRTNSEPGANAGPLHAILVNSANRVLATTPVNTDGTYQLTGIGINENNVTLRLSTTAGSIGQPPPTAGVNTAWINTSPLTTTAFNIGNTNLTNQDFGIERLPDTNNVSSSPQINLGGTNPVQVPTLSGTDPEDGTLGSGSRFRIITLPTNGTLFYDGSAVTVNQIITSYNPSLLTLDPNDGVLTASFTYASVDAASQVDPTPATVSMPFTAPGLSSNYCSVIFGVDGNLNNTSLPSKIYTVDPSTSVYTQIGTAAFFTAAAAVQPSTGRVFYVERIPTSGATQRVAYWDPVTGTNTILPSTLTPANGFPIRAAFTKTGRLFVATDTQQLIELNPVTGAQVGTQLDISLADGTRLPDGNGDMSFDENGALFYFANSNLYGVDTVTGRAYLVASAPTAGFNSLALLPNGGMYAYSSITNEFYSINTNTGALTFVNSPNFPAGVVGTDLGTCGYTAPSIAPTKTVTKFSGSPSALVRPGDILEYTITIPNSGYIIAANATLTDPIPTGTTYVANSTTMNGTAVPDGAGGTFPFATGSNISSPGSNVGVAGYGSAYTTTVKFRVQINTTNPPTLVSNQGTLSFLAEPTGGIKTDDPSLPGTVDPTNTPVTISANVLLVKRITAINGSTTNPNDGTSLNVVVDDSTPNDNHANWPSPTSGTPAVSTFLRGVIDAGNVKPGDTIEYTIYFLNAQGVEATNVRICDRITGSQTLLNGVYSGSDLQLQKGNATPTGWTSAADGDRATFFASTSGINNCNFKSTPATDNGALVVDVTGSTGSPTWTALPGAVGPGTPDSYGFIRFTTKVNP